MLDPDSGSKFSPVLVDSGLLLCSESAISQEAQMPTAVLPDIKKIVLPSEQLSISTFANFHLPSFTLPGTKIPEPDSYFYLDHEDEWASSILAQQPWPGPTVANLCDGAPAFKLSPSPLKKRPWRLIEEPSPAVSLPTVQDNDGNDDQFNGELIDVLPSKKLPSTLWHKAKQLLADESPGVRLDVLEGQQDELFRLVPTALAAIQAMTGAADFSDTEAPEQKKTMIELQFGKAGHNLLRAQLDLAIVKLLCAAALPPTLVDYKEWRDLFAIANSAYKPACSTVIVDQHIPSEAARVRSLSLQYLRMQHHLTISFDGRTIKCPKSVYTIHFTTPDGRSFLIEGEDSSDTSHTGEYLAQMLLNAMDLVGRFRFSGITSDNTGNTRVARQLVSQEVKTCVPMSDVCHHLSLLCKDLTHLEMFKEATEALEAIWKKLGIFRGLEGIGKTRFTTICAAVISLQRCLPALHELLNASLVKFPSKVNRPIAKAIVCLESSQTNPADVYKYWVAICGSIKQVLNDPANGFTDNDVGQIYAIVNSCFCEQLQQDPADRYLAAFALEPRYIQSAFLRSHPNPLAITIKVPPLDSVASLKVKVAKPDSDSDGLLKTPMFSWILKFLKQLLEVEWRSQHNLILKGKTGAEVRTAFNWQFERYIKGVYPFETPIQEHKSPLSYWHHLTLNSDSAILACITEKLFSIKPNSMPEERTIHQSWGSCLDVEDDEGIEELGEDDAATWLDEKVGTHHLHEMCFEMEQEIDQAEQDLDTTWDW
ncbi:hypothetical protein PAXRUDRAFT_28593 [Paxillus rubicundulus Ve08.2h10]|uniref:DUF659 domain-containing protein n=1 Tax=Paxillus rubicundulus Ve08.2h10 TaxID=930991 RepID=A0A0D0CT37_9AGAM|nr:hypothetical protein PAXRUDRAFT_28593 [Paxillus rubicundulus Ve08.2h10]